MDSVLNVLFELLMLYMQLEIILISFYLLDDEEEEEDNDDDDGDEAVTLSTKSFLTMTGELP